MTPAPTSSKASDREALEELAEKLFWWKSPEEALARWPRFLAQVMTLGTWNDVQTVRRICGKEAFREVLRDPPAGVFDPRSWAYWHAVFGLSVPSLPKRRLE
jgi:hypothetical protein